MAAITTFAPELLRLQLPRLVYSGCFLAGGAIRDSLVGEKPSDFDVFGSEKALRDFEVANFKDIRSTFTNGIVTNYVLDGKKFQICYRNLDNPVSFINHVDYNICQFAFDGSVIYATAEALIGVYSKKLIVANIHKEHTLDTLRRMQKYIQKGYTICDGGLNRIVAAIRALNDEELAAQVSFYPDGKERINRFD